MRTAAKHLIQTQQGAGNENFVSKSKQEKSCSSRQRRGKDLHKYMSVRSFSYWLACSITAAIAMGATEPDKAASLTFKLPSEAASAVQAVPEPSRALLLFAGIMAMAFTYRHAWLSWKRSAQS